MAMSARVSNIGGRIVGVKRGGVYHSHQHDALGNSIALINDSGVVTDTYTYWPYGELRTSTGSTTNPFKFCGAWGHYTDTTGRIYVRARTLRPSLCRWMTVDPLWRREPAYLYSKCAPTLLTDRSGLIPTRTLHSAYFACCGLSRRYWAFQTNGEVDGWLIQKITIKQDTPKMCDERPIEICPPVFFEAWYVDGQGRVNSPSPDGLWSPYAEGAAHDNWLYQDGGNSYGDRRVTASLMFVKGALPTGFKTDPSFLCNGVSPISFNFSGFIHQGGAAVFTHSWGCCKTLGKKANPRCANQNTIGSCAYPKVTLTGLPKPVYDCAKPTNNEP